jgi:hypothetical protein
MDKFNVTKPVEYLNVRTSSISPPMYFTTYQRFCRGLAGLVASATQVLSIGMGSNPAFCPLITTFLYLSPLLFSPTICSIWKYVLFFLRLCQLKLKLIIRWHNERKLCTVNLLVRPCTGPFIPVLESHITASFLFYLFVNWMSLIDQS